MINWVLIYFSWVMCSLLGYVMYQNHEAFGIDLLPGAGIDTQPPDRRTPQQIEHDATDALVAQKVTEGDLEGALGIAYEHQRTRHDELPAQRRYHRILALANKPSSLLDHAQRFIPLLLRLGQNGRGAWSMRVAGLALMLTSAWGLYMGLVHDQAPWCVVPSTH